MSLKGLAEAIYRNPNLVIPLQLRYEQFLTAMLEGLKQRGAMPEHLLVQARRVDGRGAAPRRSWKLQPGPGSLLRMSDLYKSTT